MRLIDADALLETIRKHSYLMRGEWNESDYAMTVTGIEQAIDEQLDAVVRRKDCKHADRERIENAIRHIQTSTDIDPWAMNIAVDAMNAQLLEEDTTKGTTSDCIRRQALIEKIDQDISMFEKAGHCKSADILKHVKRIVKDDLPSVQPEQHWIPCSERLPEDDTLMLVNYADCRPDAMNIWIGWHEMENVWYIDGEAHSDEYGNEVIAWMPLPEPYEGGET